jgi:hypothetical protein
MKLMPLIAIGLLSGPVLADEVPSVTKPRMTTLQKAGLGIEVGGGILLALGAGFVGGAKLANDDATRNMTYQPSAEDRRTSFSVASGVCFIVGTSAVISGVYLLWR